MCDSLSTKRYEIDASSLHLAAGDFPERLVFDGMEFERFAPDHAIVGGELDLLYWEYCSQDGDVLIVNND